MQRGGLANLFFADDSLFFGHANEDDCKEIVEILEVYKRGLGQKVNVRKSGILFSKNTREEDRSKANEILGIHRTMERDMYLGLSLLFRRSRSKELRNIKEKVWVKIKS